MTPQVFELFIIEPGKLIVGILFLWVFWRLTIAEEEKVKLMKKKDDTRKAKPD